MKGKKGRRFVLILTQLWFYRVLSSDTYMMSERSLCDVPLFDRGRVPYSYHSIATLWHTHTLLHYSLIIERFPLAPTGSFYLFVPTSVCVCFDCDCYNAPTFFTIQSGGMLHGCSAVVLLLDTELLGIKRYGICASILSLRMPRRSRYRYLASESRAG